MCNFNYTVKIAYTAGRRARVGDRALSGETATLRQRRWCHARRYRLRLPLGPRSGVANAAIVTALRPDTHMSLATATDDQNMGAPHVASDLEVRGLCAAMGDTPIRVRLHRQLPPDRVPNNLGDDRQTARLYWSTSPSRSWGARAIDRAAIVELLLAISQFKPLTTVGMTPLRASFLIATVCFSHTENGAAGEVSSQRVSCAPGSWSIKPRRSFKFPPFRTCRRFPTPRGPSRETFQAVFVGV